MSLILGIDTSTSKALICLSKNGELIALEENSEQKGHAAWLQPAVKSMLEKNGIDAPSLNAVAVTLGPGSYTGLRVGLSAAKGYCYALKIPLLGLNTLEVMAHSVLEKASDLICPMVDARRMEAFMAIYDRQMGSFLKPLAMILEPAWFEELARDHQLLLCGDGSEKLKPILKSPSISFTSINKLALSLITLAENDLKNEKFSDIAYTEPLYLKDFHSSHRPGGD